MSKAKNVKQHGTKDNQKYMEAEDDWGDSYYTVEGIQYKTKEEAKAAIHENLKKEFNSRYIPKEKE